MPRRLDRHDGSRREIKWQKTTAQGSRALLYDSFPEKRKKFFLFSENGGTAGTPVRPQNTAVFRAEIGVVLYRTCHGTAFQDGTEPKVLFVLVYFR